MTDHPYVPLPAGTALGKSFEYGLDINLGTVAVPAWQTVRRISGFAPSYPPITADVQSYDDRGATNEDVTGRSFALAFTMQVNRSVTTGLMLPEAEKLFAADKGTGGNAVVQVRWYHKPDSGVASPNDAFTGYATVSLTRQNTGNAETEWWSVALTGKGSFTAITNPAVAWTATAPTLASALPAAAAAGTIVTITGANLLGATSVKFGAVEGAEKECGRFRDRRTGRRAMVGDGDWGTDRALSRARLWRRAMWS